MSNQNASTSALSISNNIIQGALTETNSLCSKTSNLNPTDNNTYEFPSCHSMMDDQFNNDTIEKPKIGNINPLK